MESNYQLWQTTIKDNELQIPEKEYKSMTGLTYAVMF